MSKKDKKNSKWEVLVDGGPDDLIDPTPTEIIKSLEQSVRDFMKDNEGFEEDEDVAIEALLSEIEVSVIRKNNKFGHESCGWPDKNKVIISGDYMMESLDDLLFWLKVADILRDGLNKENI